MNNGTIRHACPQCFGSLKYIDSGVGSPHLRCVSGCKLNKEQIESFWSDLQAKEHCKVLKAIQTRNLEIGS